MIVCNNSLANNNMSNNKYTILVLIGCGGGNPCCVDYPSFTTRIVGPRTHLPFHTGAHCNKTPFASVKSNL